LPWLNPAVVLVVLVVLAVQEARAPAVEPQEPELEQAAQERVSLEPETLALAQTEQAASEIVQLAWEPEQAQARA
jgi:hypothetical protein